MISAIMEAKEIKIGGVIYEIEDAANLRGDKDQQLDGWIRYGPAKILLSSEMGGQRRRVVLWHEVLHGIMTQAGYDKHDEALIDALAYGIVQVLQDNPILVGDEDV